MQQKAAREAAKPHKGHKREVLLRLRANETEEPVSELERQEESACCQAHTGPADAMVETVSSRVKRLSSVQKICVAQRVQKNQDQRRGAMRRRRQQQSVLFLLADDLSHFTPSATLTPHLASLASKSIVLPRHYASRSLALRDRSPSAASAFPVPPGIAVCVTKQGLVC